MKTKKKKKKKNSVFDPGVGTGRLLLCWPDRSQRRERLVQVQHRRVLAHERLRCLPRRKLVLVRFASASSLPFYI